MHCSRCKEDKAKKENKYYGGVFCDKCLSYIKKRIKSGTMPNFRGLVKIKDVNKSGAQV